MVSFIMDTLYFQEKEMVSVNDLYEINHMM